MKTPMGRKCWAIAEGYIPASSHGPGPEMTSHEAVCLLNTAEQDAHGQITIYFADRQPGGPYNVTVPSKRTRHVRFNNLEDPTPIPSGTDYASTLNRTCPSWCSIRDSIHDRTPTLC